MFIYSYLQKLISILFLTNFLHNVKGDNITIEHTTINYEALQEKIGEEVDELYKEYNGTLPKESDPHYYEFIIKATVSKTIWK